MDRNENSELPTSLAPRQSPLSQMVSAALSVHSEASTVTYRIRDWNSHFENNRTRDLKRMDWVPVPNRHDGDGFTELLDHPHGMAHYGAWHLILQVASKCDPRGTLVREGAGGVKIAHTADSLARITRGSKKVFDEVIPRLLSIGWLESCENPAPRCDIPAPHCDSVTMEGKGTEGNGMEGGGNGTSPVLTASERITYDGELKRIIKEIEKIRSRYQTGDQWKQEDRERIKVLKKRQEDLRELLGVVA